ncbi:hypothetical protein HRbin37_01972 [bacterium HR37]|jgi:uncharacterized integral membrane protein|nr:hypothetical protein HRbin37_01972 [bacterium HR37]
MHRIKNIAVLIIVILIVIVLAQNAGSVEVRFLFWNFSTSAFIMYLIFYIAGILSAIIGRMLWQSK